MSNSDSIAEAIRGAYRRDWLGIGDQALEPALLELLDPEVVFVPEAAGAGATTPYVGVHALAALLREARGDWRSCRYVLDEVEEASGEVLVTGWLLADVRETGSRVSFPFAHLWTVRGKRIVRLAAYHDPTEAAAALTASLAAA